MSLARYERVPAADVSANTYRGEVIGNKTDAAVYVVGTTKSLVAYLKGILAGMVQGTSTLNTRVAMSATAVMVNGDTIFTIAGGAILVEALYSECVVTGNTTASTVQYSLTHAVMGDVTISAASGSVASSPAGSVVTLQTTALNTAALYASEGATIIATGPSKILLQPGILTVVIGTGSTTSTWRHWIRYQPMAVGVTVV
jgi:hypothetical protein